VNLDHLSREEIEGGYRRLCASMIAHSAFIVAERGMPTANTNQKMYYRGEIKKQQAAARAWMYGGDAVLPFAEACNALDMEEDGVREGLERFASNPDLTLSRRWRRYDVPRKRQPITPVTPERE
jgi:hypothetical protein